MKVFALLCADDAALVTEDRQELTSMLKTLERWTDENKMEVDAEENKIMIFRNGVRRKRESTKEKKIEVREFKYLGFWFSIKNQYSTHIKKTASKKKQTVNKV